MFGRLVLAGLLTALFLAALPGCDSSTAQDPVVVKPTVKSQPVPIKTGKPGEGGSSFTAN